MLRFDRKQQNSVKQLSFNKKINYYFLKQQYTADSVILGYKANFAGLMNKLGLKVHSQNGTCLYAGDFL